LSNEIEIAGAVEEMCGTRYERTAILGNIKIDVDALS
jgi:hypothetical protein